MEFGLKYAASLAIGILTYLKETKCSMVCMASLDQEGLN